MAGFLDGQTVLTLDSEVYRLSDAWKSRPVWLTFIRHFGCIFCREHVTVLDALRPRVEALGADLVVVGNGTPEMARYFRDERQPKVTMYVDPSLRVYKAAGLQRSLGSTLNRAALSASLRALAGGHFQGRTRGDPWQQGGTFVVFPGGEVRFRHISGFAGDHPDPERVIAALGRRAA